MELLGFFYGNLCFDCDSVAIMCLLVFVGLQAFVNLHWVALYFLRISIEL